jgi:hypothetical protein
MLVSAALAAVTLLSSAVRSSSDSSPNALAIAASSGLLSSGPGVACPRAISMSRKLYRPCWRLVTSGSRQIRSMTAIGSAKQFSALRLAIASSSSAG